MRLEDLGPRICIMGPSGSGKSTLAAAIGRRSGASVTHLDQCRFDIYTTWVMRSNEDFEALHREAIAGDHWVIDGNYTSLLPLRFSRATGLILLDSQVLASLGRYVGRTLGLTGQRVGGLAEGVEDRLSWSMIRYILGPARSKRRRYKCMFDDLTLPKIYLPDRSAVRRFYRDHELSR